MYRRSAVARRRVDKADGSPSLLNPLEAEIAVTALQATGNYRVLRRLDLENDPRLTRRRTGDALIGLCLDTETTGFDCPQDLIIELGLVAFEYDPESGEIARVVDCYSGCEDPGRPLSEEVKLVTGISDDLLRGQRLDDDRVEELARKASLVIAHNASFDRKFVEARFPVFADLPWACTLAQIDWQRELISSRTLEYLLFRYGWFIDAHRAVNDAEGLLGLLLEKLPRTGTPLFRELLARSRETTARISAINAPFDSKDRLKDRGYRWSDGKNGRPKAWWIEISGDSVDEEMAFLAREIYPRGDMSAVELVRITATDRFSLRG
jgi:DNA polymerase-3 subunit epsilon